MKKTDFRSASFFFQVFGAERVILQNRPTTMTMMNE